jgi:hypothetical protein
VAQTTAPVVDKGGATRAPSKSVQTLPDQYGKGLDEVLKEEQ